MHIGAPCRRISPLPFPPIRAILPLRLPRRRVGEERSPRVVRLSKTRGGRSFCFLPGSGARDTRTLPLGTAYAVWTGIGALGALIVGVIVFRESLTPARLLFAALLLIGIIGLKATA